MDKQIKHADEMSKCMKITKKGEDQITAKTEISPNTMRENVREIL